MKSNHAAKMVGVSPDTLHYYEKRGLLPAPPRAHNGYRDYSPAHVSRANLIQRALAFGFTLDEVGLVFSIRRAGGRACPKALAILKSRLEQLDRDLEAMKHLRSEMRLAIADWSLRIRNSHPGQPPGLIESLPCETLKPARRLQWRLQLKRYNGANGTDLASGGRR